MERVCISFELPQRPYAYLLMDYWISSPKNLSHSTMKHPFFKYNKLSRQAGQTAGKWKGRLRIVAEVGKYK